MFKDWLILLEADLFIYVFYYQNFLLIIEHPVFVLCLAFQLQFIFFFEWSTLSDLFGDRWVATLVIWI